MVSIDSTSVQLRIKNLKPILHTLERNHHCSAIKFEVKHHSHSRPILTVQTAPDSGNTASSSCSVSSEENQCGRFAITYSAYSVSEKRSLVCLQVTFDKQYFLLCYGGGFNRSGSELLLHWTAVICFVAVLITDIWLGTCWPAACFSLCKQQLVSAKMLKRLSLVLFWKSEVKLGLDS